MNATIIDGNGYVTEERVFHVQEDDAMFLDLTVRNGNGSRGAGIFAHTDGTVTVQRSSVHSNISSTNGGGITATQGATLNVIDSEVSNNSAPGEGVGGGIYVSDEGEEVTIQNSIVNDNFAYYAGGGIYIAGGVPTLIDNSTVSGNATRSELPVGLNGYYGGGGILIEPPFTIARSGSEAQPPFSSLIIDTTVHENSSASSGGGILVGCCGFLEIVESTISNNTAAENGGGIYNITGIDGGETEMENVTVSSNYADVDGGGIYNVENGEMWLSHTTVYRNEASPAGTAGGIYDATPVNGGTVHYEYSIIAKNTYEDCGPPGGGPVSEGYNLLGDFSCASTGTDFSPTETLLDPGLAPLRDNGDTESPHERTHELLPGSPAIDLVDGEEVDCPPPATDQRGLARFTGAACDAGAYEVGSLDQAPGPDVGGEVVTKPALCRKQNPTILGTLGPDRLVGTNGPDIIQGLDARDVILGKGGDDIICGSLGNDLLKGQGGDDWTKGLRGDDTDRGGPGTDKCVRGPGEDEYFSCENIPNN